MAEIISGRDIAGNIIETDLIPRVERLKEKGVIPKLVVILGINATTNISY